MYNELYSAWQSEIEESELTSLPSDFYPRVADYLKRIIEATSKVEKKSLKASLLEIELQNTKHLVRSLVRIRYRKLKKAIRGNRKIPSESLTPEEQKTCENLLNFAEAYSGFVKNLLGGQSTKLEKEPPEKPHRIVVVRFVKPIPAVIGSDMKTYGPFSQEDVASLPVENARILVKQGLAAMVEVS